MKEISFSHVMSKKKIFSKEAYGSFAIFISMFCFYLETAVVRRATTTHVALSTPFLVFARFFLGFIVVGCVFLFQRKIPRPRQCRLILARAVTNILAVFCSYKAVELTTLAEGSILNMTYPVFIGVFSWVLFKGQRDGIALLMTFVAFLGIFLVLSPGKIHVEFDSLWGLTSGMLAAISLIMLNIARQENDTNTILLVVFSTGTVLLYLCFKDYLYLPNTEELFYLVSGATMALMGQYLLTMGFRYVTPVEGGIISSTRILMAAFLGPYITSDPALTVTGWIGALLILGTNVYFVLRKSTE